MLEKEKDTVESIMVKAQTRNSVVDSAKMKQLQEASEKRFISVVEPEKEVWSKSVLYYYLCFDTTTFDGWFVFCAKLTSSIFLESSNRSV